MLNVNGGAEESNIQISHDLWDIKPSEPEIIAMWDLKRLPPLPLRRSYTLPLSSRNDQLDFGSGPQNHNSDLTIIPVQREPMISAAEERRSSEILDRRVKCWEVSSVHNHKLNSSFKEVDDGESRSPLVDRGLKLLDSNLKILHDIFNDSSVSSFSGFFGSTSPFHDTADISARLSSAEMDLRELERMSLSRRLSSAAHVVDEMQVAAQELVALKISAGEQSRSSKIVNHSKLSEGRSRVVSPMMTRLRGSVKDLPHVQPSVLEYKSKKKTSNL
jgi:hypothetical protein